MHVDQDENVSKVMFVSIGATALFAVHHRAEECERIEALDSVMGRVSSEAKNEALKKGCDGCTLLELESGDVCIFDGHPDAGIAHGVLDVLAGTVPEDLPAWAADCRVSLQYRLFKPKAAGSGQAQSAAAAGGAGGSCAKKQRR